MKLELSLINPPWEDPAIFVQADSIKEAWMLDCGNISRMSIHDMLRVKNVFLSHTHIDHFIGFDWILRMNLGHDTNICVYGPKGLTANIQGKLNAYAWNLTSEATYTITTCEILEEKLIWTTFDCSRYFAVTDSYETENKGFLPLADNAKVHFAPLVHKVECLAYALEEPPRYSVRTKVLEAMQLPTGPWLSQLKKIMAGNDASSLKPAEAPSITVADQAFNALELGERLISKSPARRIAYITDSIFNKKSVASINRIAHGADELWCESCYMHAHLDKARQNYHFTARQAGRLASELQVGKLFLFHYSRRYEHNIMPQIEEAKAYFAQTLPAKQYKTID